MGKRRGPQIPGNMGNMMKQVQKMQRDMAKKQAEIEEMEFEATAGGGVVKVIANGKKQITSIELKEEVVDPDDIEMLQDLIIVAVNEAISQAEAKMGEAMGMMTGGLNVPGLF